MDTRKKVSKEALRTVLQALGEGGKEITCSLVYEAMGIADGKEQAIVRSRMADMARSGEVKRTEFGRYVYNFGCCPREEKSYDALWRFVRKAKPGWTISECAMMTRVSYSQALRYCIWLEEEGFAMREGKNERNAATWKGTVKADRTPETPYPPAKEADPFARERTAAAAIARLMLCANPHAKRTAQGITEACQVLLARFDNNCTETENENLTEKAPC